MISAPRTLERFHAYLLLILGITVIGLGVTVMGFATASPAAVGMGVGAVVAAGLMAIFFARTGPLLTGQERVSTDAGGVNICACPEIGRMDAVSAIAEAVKKPFFEASAFPAPVHRANFVEAVDLVCVNLCGGPVRAAVLVEVTAPAPRVIGSPCAGLRLKFDDASRSNEAAATICGTSVFTQPAAQRP